MLKKPLSTRIIRRYIVCLFAKKKQHNNEVNLNRTRKLIPLLRFYFCSWMGLVTGIAFHTWHYGGNRWLWQSQPKNVYGSSQKYYCSTLWSFSQSRKPTCPRYYQSSHRVGDTGFELHLNWNTSLSQDASKFVIDIKYFQ